MKKIRLPLTILAGLMALVVGYRMFTNDHFTKVDHLLMASVNLIFLIYYIPDIYKSWQKNKNQIAK